MNSRLRKAFIAATLAVLLPMSMTPALAMQASPASTTSLVQEAIDSADTLHACKEANHDESIAVPYVAVAAAEELIADGIIDADVVAAFNETETNVTIVGPQPQALPIVAALAVAGVTWCAKDALSSVVPSALQEMAHRANSNVPPPDWVLSAIFGCAGGPVLGALTSQAVRLKFAAAVLATVIKLRNFG